MRVYRALQKSLHGLAGTFLHNPVQNWVGSGTNSATLQLWSIWFLPHDSFFISPRLRTWSNFVFLDPYVKLKLLDSKGKRIGKKKKTTVKMCNLNPYYNESFVFIVEQEMLRVIMMDE